MPIRDAAARIGITNTTMNRFERGERRMYLHQAATLAELYGVPLDMLIREPTVDDQLVLRDMWLKSKQPAPGPGLLPRPIFTTGGGLTKTSRPLTDEELRQQGKDPALYVPGPASAQAYVGALVDDLEHHDAQSDQVDPAWQQRYDTQQPVQSPEEDKWRLDRMLEEVGLGGGVDD